jgi:hypothetical protein
MVDDAALVAWAERLESRGFRHRTKVDGDLLEIDASNQNELDLSQGVEGARVRLTRVGVGQQSVRVVGDERISDFFLDEVTASLPQLQLNGLRGALSISVDGTAASETRLYGDFVGDLQLLGGRWDIRLGRDSIHRLAVITAQVTFTGNAPLIRRLTLSGNVTLARLSAEETIIQPPVVIYSAGDVDLGAVSKGLATPVELTFGSASQSISLRDLPPNSEILLDGAIVSLSPSSVQGPTSRGVTFRGTGRVVVTTSLESPTFEPARTQSLILELTQQGQVSGAKGRVVLNAQPGSQCIGVAKTPLVLDRVDRAERAELEHVSLQRLLFTDLAALREAERLIPWMPPVSNLSKARKYVDDATAGGGEPDLIATKRAHFWTRLSYMLADKHTPGSVQSSVRWASMRSRRLAAPRWGRERLLLFAYSLVGYGERILLPIFWQLVVTSTFAFWVFHAGRHHMALSLKSRWEQALQLPLTIFRVLENGNLLHPTWAVALIRVTGIVLIGLALLAMRRVVKAE